MNNLKTIKSKWKTNHKLYSRKTFRKTETLDLKFRNEKQGDDQGNDYGFLMAKVIHSLCPTLPKNHLMGKT